MWDKCNDTRKCYARNELGGCMILIHTYPKNGQCKFCKRSREVTKGKRYPTDKKYAGG